MKGDLEYVTIHVQPGQQLEHVVVASYVSSDTKAFIGIQQGAVFTEPNTGGVSKRYDCLVKPWR